MGQKGNTVEAGPNTSTCCVSHVGGTQKLSIITALTACPATVLCTLYALSYLVLAVTREGKQCYARLQTKSARQNNLPKVTTVFSLGSRDRRLAPKPMLLILV